MEGELQVNAVTCPSTELWHSKEERERWREEKVTEREEQGAKGEKSNDKRDETLSAR